MYFETDHIHLKSRKTTTGARLTSWFLGYARPIMTMNKSVTSFNSLFNYICSVKICISNVKILHQTTKWIINRIAEESKWSHSILTKSLQTFNLYVELLISSTEQESQKHHFWIWAAQASGRCSQTTNSARPRKGRSDGDGVCDWNGWGRPRARRRLCWRGEAGGWAF